MVAASNSVKLARGVVDGRGAKDATPDRRVVARKNVLDSVFMVLFVLDGLQCKNEILRRQLLLFGWSMIKRKCQRR